VNIKKYKDDSTLENKEFSFDTKYDIYIPQKYQKLMDECKSKLTRRVSLLFVLENTDYKNEEIIELIESLKLYLSLVPPYMWRPHYAYCGLYKLLNK